MLSAVPLVRVVRSGLVESVHAGHVAVCDARGRLLAALGDPHRIVFSRSAMKPLQAAVSLRRMGEELPLDLVAIMCASHNGEGEHVRAVRRLLRRGGVPVSALGCPSDLPPLPSHPPPGPRSKGGCGGRSGSVQASSTRSSAWTDAGLLSTACPCRRWPPCSPACRVLSTWARRPPEPPGRSRRCARTPTSSRVVDGPTPCSWPRSPGSFRRWVPRPCT